jgi:hypothetical protein
VVRDQGECVTFDGTSSISHADIPSAK